MYSGISSKLFVFEFKWFMIGEASRPGGRGGAWKGGRMMGEDDGRGGECLRAFEAVFVAALGHGFYARFGVGVG